MEANSPDGPDTQPCPDTAGRISLSRESCSGCGESRNAIAPSLVTRLDSDSSSTGPASRINPPDCIFASSNVVSQLANEWGVDVFKLD